MVEDAKKELKFYLEKEVEKYTNIKIEIVNKRIDISTTLRKFHMSLKEIDYIITSMIELNECISNNLVADKMNVFTKIIYKSNLPMAYKSLLISNMLNVNIKFYENIDNIEKYIKMNSKKEANNMSELFDERKNNYLKLRKYIDENGKIKSNKELGNKDYENFIFLEMDPRIISNLFDTSLRNYENECNYESKSM